MQPAARNRRFDYRFNGLRKTLSIGVYPDVELGPARDGVREERKRLRAGIDPSVARREDKRKAAAETRDTFEALAGEWLEHHKGKLAPRPRRRSAGCLRGYLFPQIGRHPIAQIEPPELLAALRRIEARGRHETAHRTKQISGQVFRYAIAGRATRDPSADLRGALAPVVTTHRAALTDPAAIGGLLRAIESFSGSFVVWQALRLAPLVFVRPGELRKAEWSEMNLEAALWRIPAAKMKTREPHLVPLSRQAVTVLRELHALTGRGRYCFPSIRAGARPMSDMSLNAALRRLGYGRDEMTAHGFRTLASTRLNEMGWRPDLIERQLAHVEKDAVRSAYNRALYLDERQTMMQRWADHLDALRDGTPALVVAS